ncbi:MAG TPA: aromatic ring-hydroxylating dioxygenase subunit alpha [Bryobacteraceae bacterium]|jgi:choline monooxygenase
MQATTEDFAAVLEHDQGLPGRHFTDEAVFQLECRAIFEKSWFCIGLSADVPAKGDLSPVTVFGQPLLMARDGATVRVFHNVCSHRGALLVGTPVHGGPRIVCPYHSWAYKLDGTLVATPHIGGAGRHNCPSIDTRGLGLRSVPVAEWAGHVFVNLSGTAPPFEQWIRPAKERFGTIPWHDLRRDPALAQFLDVAANWKIICENFVESYHLPPVHVALNAANPMEQHYQILGGHSYLGQGGTGYQPDQIAGAGLPQMAELGDGSKYEALVIFPNLILAPLPDMTFSIVMLPDSAGRTRERLEFHFVGDTALEDRFRPLREQGAAFVANVNAEDVGIVETVQRGRRSPAFVGGQFAPAQEATSLQFQKMVAARILAPDPSRPEDVVSLATRDILHQTT